MTLTDPVSTFSTSGFLTNVNVIIAAFIICTNAFMYFTATTNIVHEIFKVDNFKVRARAAMCVGQ